MSKLEMGNSFCNLGGCMRFRSVLDGAAVDVVDTKTDRTVNTLGSGDFAATTEAIRRGEATVLSFLHREDQAHDYFSAAELAAGGLYVVAGLVRVETVIQQGSVIARSDLADLSLQAV